MTDEARAFIIEILTLLGQMDHPPRGKDVGMMILKMKVEDRSRLIAKGWWDILNQTTPTKE